MASLIFRFGRPCAHAVLPHLRLEPLRHVRGHELLDGGAEGGELLHARRGDEEVLGGRHQVHHLDPRGERPVHVRHLELELEVRERADPAHDEASRRSVREVDLQAVEARDLDVAVLRAALTHELDAFVGGEDRLLREVATDADDDAIEEARGPLDDVEMAVRGGVEGAGVDRNGFGYAGRASFPESARRRRILASAVRTLSAVLERNGHPTFSDAEFARRLAAVRAKMDERALALLLLYGARHTAEIAYLANWPGTREAFLVVPREGEPTLLVQLYNHVPNARRAAITRDVRWAGARSIDGVMTALAERSLPDGGAVGLVGPWRWGDVDALRERFPLLRFVEAGKIVRDLRTIKSTEELGFLRTAARFTDLAMRALEREVRPGLPEHEPAHIVESRTGPGA